MLVRSAVRVMVTAVGVAFALALVTVSQATADGGDAINARLSPVATPVGLNGSDLRPSVGRVFMTFPGGQESVCSGNLIQSANRDVVATAGHCLYSPQWGGYATSVRFVMGYGSFSHQVELPVRTWQIVPGYVDSASSEVPQHDSAFLVLGTDANGQHAGDIAAATVPRFESAGTGRRTGYGYPGTGNQLRSCGGDLAAGTFGNLPTLECGKIFQPGASGGPVIALDGSQDGVIVRKSEASGSVRMDLGKGTTIIESEAAKSFLQMWDGTAYGTYDWAQHQ
jgi:V8-like Glu-specific endopeptidase